MDRLLCGIDGGGTTTSVVVCDQSGIIIGSFKAESINHYGVGTARARDVFRSIKDALVARAGRLPDAIFIGSSALEAEATGAEATEITGGVFGPSRLLLHSDVYIALLGFTQGRSGAILISGTGSMACGLDSKGIYKTSGGWGQTLGDEGSGYHLALMGIQAALRGYDGISGPTELTGAVRQFFGLNRMTGLIDLVYNPPMEKSRIAAFAPEVERIALVGDPIARQILDDEVEWLSKLAVSIVSKCGATEIGLYGSMLVKSPVIGDRLKHLLKNRGIEARFPEFKPEVGALFGAFGLLEIPVTGEVLANLKAYGG